VKTEGVQINLINLIKMYMTNIVSFGKALQGPTYREVQLEYSAKRLLLRDYLELTLFEFTLGDIRGLSHD